VDRRLHHHFDPQRHRDQGGGHANLLLMIFQFLVLAIFVALSLRHVVHTGGAGALVSSTPFLNPRTTISSVSAGAALAAYSFLGFDAITTLTEETIEPKKTIPRAILLVILIGGGIFLVVTYSTQLVHPGGSFADVSSASFAIAKTIGGDVFSSVFLAGLVVTQFASGLAAQTAVARLLYAMGRDSVLPKRIFAYIHPKFHTPAINVLLAGLVGLIVLELNVAASTSFINFGAFSAFTFVNLCVIAMFIRQRRERRSFASRTPPRHQETGGVRTATATRRPVWWFPRSVRPVPRSCFPPTTGRLPRGPPRRSD
jgi:putrescine importer